MNRLRILTFILTIVLFGTVTAPSQELDQELSTLATKLATLTKDNGKQKVTVLDFTDLQGGGSELGKYIAEELTVNLVMVKKDFSVLDRANLQRILAEHKLTAQGLVDPENAKKLGQFAGVDAIVLGTIIPKGQNIGLTAKIITTDTAEIVGAARAEFTSDETVKHLASLAASSNDTTGLGSTAPKAIVSQEFGNLRFNVDRLQILSNRDVIIYFSLQNKSAQKSIAVGFYSEACFVGSCYLLTTLVGANGDQFFTRETDLKGVQSIRANPARLTEIAPGASLKASIQFGEDRTSSRTTSFTLQSKLVINQDYKATTYENYRVTQDELPPGCKVYNLLVDIPSP